MQAAPHILYPKTAITSHKELFCQRFFALSRHDEAWFVFNVQCMCSFICYTEST